MSTEDDGNNEKAKATMPTRPRSGHRSASVGAVMSDSRSGPPLRTARSRLWQGTSERLVDLLVALGIFRRRDSDGSVAPRNWRHLGMLFGLMVFGVFVLTSVQIVAPGSVEVPVTLGHEGEPLAAGFHFTWPFTVTYGMTTRTQAYTMTALKNEAPAEGSAAAVMVLGADGEGAQVDATVLYRVDPKQASKLYEAVGRDYTTKVVRPSSRNCVRTAFTEYPMVQGATSAWGRIASDIEGCLRSKFEPIGLVLQDFQLREVALSDELQKAIDKKTAAQQKAQQQVFDLATAQQQANIARVNAKATADSQQIIACGSQVVNAPSGSRTVPAIEPKPLTECSQAQLTPQFLTLYYIQTLQQLIASGNATTVLLPNNATPLIDVNAGTASVAPNGSSNSSATNSGASVPQSSGAATGVR
jgi:regulator of protease activity HflC (stomatin/prohibitin superfamily)